MVKTLTRWIIRCYQIAISPLLGGACRFYPSCSEYGRQAFDHYSWWKAFGLTLKRFLRCHPFCEGGFDPVWNKPE